MSAPTFPCRQCQTMLSADAADPGAMVLCAVCRAAHTPTQKATSAADRDQMISEAKTGLIFGLVSIVFCPAAYPAIALGVQALRKIRRSGDTLAGKGAAQAAIALGVVWGVLSPLAASTFALPVVKLLQATEDTADPERVARINARFRAEPLPPWLLPVRGTEKPVQSSRQVVFADAAPPSHVLVVVVEVPAMVGKTAADNAFSVWQQNQQMEFVAQSSRQLTWSESDQSLAVNLETGVDPRSQQPQRRYTSLTPRGERQLAICVLTGETDSAQPSARSLSEEEVKKIFLSYTYPREPAAR